MKTIKFTAIAMILGVLATPLNAYAADGFFLGASVGSASLDEDFDGLRVDDSTQSYSLIGGWRFNPNFALEAGYLSFGDFAQDFNIGGNTVRARLSADGFTFGAQGSFPVTQKVSVFGRAGAFFWNGSAELVGVSQASPSDINPYLGVGLAYGFTDRLSVNVDLTRYELDTNDSEVLALGLRYQFGQ